MRNVVLYTLLSLDGVAESPSEFVRDFDDVMVDNLRRVIETQDAVLLGRTMYDEWSHDWPDSDLEPFASFINGVRKYVATSSELTTSWHNSTVVEGPVESAVRDLKTEPGGDIGVHGSIRLAQSLLRSGLVDELRLVISPTIAGRGRQLFESDADRRNVELVRSVGTPSGSLLVDYRITR